MKSLQDLLPKPDTDGDLVHYYTGNDGYIPINPPIPCNEMSCKYCGNREGYCWTNPEKERVWICGRICSPSKLINHVEVSNHTTQPKRSLQWPLFCELNGIGDMHHNLSFDFIEQSAGKVEFLRKFANKPSGIILMRGKPGTGKTYASMGLCELFTRSKTSARFFTNKSLTTQWLGTFKSDKPWEFTQKVENAELLVIDDFGTSDPSPAFLTFFMDLINTRMQWTDRGTVITTNLSAQKLSEFCGEALSDRLKTATQFVFEETSRRKPTIL